MDTTRSTSTMAYRSAAPQMAVPQMRASDADRDLALAELSRHFEAGRLTAEELDERMGLALSARTLGDLGTLMSDLPSEPEPESVPVSRPVRPYPVVQARIVALTTVLLIVLLSMSAGHSGHSHSLGLLVLVLPAIIVIRHLAHRGPADPTSRRR